MMYISDDAVDAAVAKDRKLQDAVHGRTLMLWRPGTLAVVAAQGCLMFGGIGLIGSVLLLWPQDKQAFKYAFFFGLLPLATLTAGLFQLLTRGWRQARTFNYRFALAMTALSVCAGIVSLLLWKKVSLGAAGASFVFHLGALRLIAGEGYALTSGIFRAQRKYARAQSR